MRILPSERGLVLDAPALALDVHAPGRPVVVSHAHADHVPWDAEEAYATPETAALLEIRAPHLRVRAVPYGQPFQAGDATVTFHAAGHVLGSAMVHVEHDGDTLLYTGDAKLRPSLTCAPAEHLPHARTLVTETTFGLPVFRFPPVDEVRARVVRFAKETLAEGRVPVLLGYSLGKGQELCAMLTRAGVPTMAHGAAHNLCDVYERFGHAFPGLKPYDRDTVDGHALVVPPRARTQPMVQNLRKRRIAYCSGWAHLERSRTQRDADALIPLSDHFDFPELLELVRRVQPERVIATHGYSRAFAHILRTFEGVPATAHHEGRSPDEEEADE